MKGEFFQNEGWIVAILLLCAISAYGEGKGFCTWLFLVLALYMDCSLT